MNKIYRKPEEPLLTKYKSIIGKHNLKVTNERIMDFKTTLKEIVDAKNGKIPPDSIIEEKEKLPTQFFKQRASKSVLMKSQKLTKNTLNLNVDLNNSELLLKDINRSSVYTPTMPTAPSVFSDHRISNIDANAFNFNKSRNSLNLNSFSNTKLLN